jgi:hypothetical protein
MAQKAGRGSTMVPLVGRQMGSDGQIGELVSTMRVRPASTLERHLVAARFTPPSLRYCTVSATTTAIYAGPDRC